mgnify:CR=1 FL=1
MESVIQGAAGSSRSLPTPSIPIRPEPPRTPCHAGERRPPRALLAHQLLVNTRADSAMEFPGALPTDWHKGSDAMPSFVAAKVESIRVSASSVATVEEFLVFFLLQSRGEIIIVS